jgi:hypothetical protein
MSRCYSSFGPNHQAHSSPLAEANEAALIHPNPSWENEGPRPWRMASIEIGVSVMQHYVVAWARPKVCKCLQGESRGMQFTSASALCEFKYTLHPAYSHRES